MTYPLPLLGIRLDAATGADPARLASQARRAESLGFDVVLLDDAPGAPSGLDPIEAAGYVGAVTDSVGIVAAAAATYAEPYHLANRLSSLDWGTHGRAGWLVTIDRSDARARAYSASVADEPTARREAEAVLDAVRRLWDSWEDGALVADSEAGRFLDADRLHYIDVDTEFFRLRGPGLMPRPPQGQPLVLAPAHDRIAGADVAVVEEAGAARGPELVRVPVTADSDAEELLDDIAEAGAATLLQPWSTDAALDRLAAALAARGALPRPGRTLRDRFGLPRPAGRYQSV